jgi:hypothetical protein
MDSRIQIINPRLPSAALENDGCEVSHSCLVCPLPKCKYDESIDSQLRKVRDANVISLYYDHHMPEREISRRLPDISQWLIKDIIRIERKNRSEGNPTDFSEYLQNHLLRS